MKLWQVWPAVLIVAAGTFAKGSAQDPQILPAPQANAPAVAPDSTVTVSPQTSTGSPPVYQGTEFDPYVTGPYGVPYIPVPPSPPPARAGHWWQKPCGCYSDTNCAGCWNCKTNWIFVFGSCREFFGQPCIKQVPAVPLPAGYGASYFEARGCACP